MLRALGLVLLSLATGCTSDGAEFVCTSDAQCILDGVGGTCDSTSHCNFPDSTCPSGKRYVFASLNNCVPQDLSMVQDLSAVQDLSVSQDMSELHDLSRDLCVGSQYDPNNCGGCGIVCSSAQVCNAGVCGCPIAIPNYCTTDMDNFCTNEQTDNANCGSCGNECASGQLCQSGVCVETCATTPILYVSCGTYCANLQTDLNNCGSCGTMCAVAGNSTAVACVHSQCVQCSAGYVACSSGCCVPDGLALVAGQLGGPGNTDGVGIGARFNLPGGLTLDASGNIFVSDTSNRTIRKITAAGMVSTLAGGVDPGVSGGPEYAADGTGTAARFDGPRGLSVDANDNLFIADFAAHTIRKVTSAGVVTTVAGTAYASGTSDGTGAAARFNQPSDVVVDTTGNIFLADAGNSAIRKITAGGVVTTFAGLAGSAGTVDGTGTSARFAHPYYLTIDANSNLFVADEGNNAIRKITPSGVVSTFAGIAGSNLGSADGTGTAAQFNKPYGVTVDASAHLFVVDTYNTVRKITAAAVVSTIAGTANLLDGTTDGVGSVARFGNPQSIVVDANDDLFIADTNNSTIRKVTPAGVVSTFAGSAVSTGTTDGTGSAAQFHFLIGVAVDASGDIYVVDADTNRSTIRKITASGVVTTLAGSTALGSADGTGTAAQFRSPSGVAVDASGNIYVADSGNHTIRQITASGVVTTLAGNATTGSADGTGTAAQFASPSGIVVDASGNIYVADRGNHTIRKIVAGGVVSTLAGTALFLGSVDGTGSAARFSAPAGVAVDASGNVYVADTNNNTIRKITANGVVSTLAGSAGSIGSADGTGSAAQFSLPNGLTVDASGNVFVSDNGNATIRKITPASVVTTIIGVAGASGVGLGPFPASLKAPGGVAAYGNTLIISDHGENAILRATKNGGF